MKKLIMAVLALLFLFVGCASETPVEEITQKQEEQILADDDIIFPEASTESNSVVRGRGKSDIGHEEPRYEALTGYVAVYDGEGDSIDASWMVPIYAKDKQFYVEIGSVSHKTEIKVISQSLEQSTRGYYHGYLLVESIENHESFYLNVKNFVSSPYWEGEDLLEMASEGEFIAEYVQHSDFYPVTKKNKKAELVEGTRVVVTGKTGIIAGIDNRTHQIEAKTPDLSKVYFNIEDLRILY